VEKPDDSIEKKPSEIKNEIKKDPAE